MEDSRSRQDQNTLRGQEVQSLVLLSPKSQYTRQHGRPSSHLQSRGMRALTGVSMLLEPLTL